MRDRARRAVRISQADWRAHGAGADLPPEVLGRRNDRLLKLASLLNVDAENMRELFDTTAGRLLMRVLLSDLDLDALVRPEPLTVVRPGGRQRNFTDAELNEAAALRDMRPAGQALRVALEEFVARRWRGFESRKKGLKSIMAAIKRYRPGR